MNILVYSVYILSIFCRPGRAPNYILLKRVYFHYIVSYILEYTTGCRILYHIFYVYSWVYSRRPRNIQQIYMKYTISSIRIYINILRIYTQICIWIYSQEYIFWLSGFNTNFFGVNWHHPPPPPPRGGRGIPPRIFFQLGEVARAHLHRVLTPLR